MWKLLKWGSYFVVLAGLGILLGCYIHAGRVNQTTLMSGVAFVRELPYGEQTVGLIETAVFTYQERTHLEEFKDKYEGRIHIDPEVLKKHKELFQQKGSGGSQ